MDPPTVASQRVSEQVPSEIRHSNSNTRRPIPPASSNPQTAGGDALPTYAELAVKEGHRFGRWRGWIEKRARERIHDRNEERRQAEAQGRSFGTGWDLPDHHSQSNHPTNHPSNSNSPGSATRHQNLDRNPSIISSQNEHAAFASAAQHHKKALYRKSEGITSKTLLPPVQPRLFLEPGPGAVSLTPSTSIHQIGSRFLPQFNSQPLCAVPFPVNNPNLLADGRKIERFLLVGTADGLYVCDLVPALSHTIKTDSISSTDSKIYKIWTGLSVHQLEIAVEENEGQKVNSTGAMSGILIALTTQLSRDSNPNVDAEGLNKSIRMWPLQSIINLVKFRAFSENSECLDLFERTNTKRMSALSAGTHALVGLMSIFDKGKNKAENGSIVHRNLSITTPRGTMDSNEGPSSMPMQANESRTSPSRGQSRDTSSNSNTSPLRRDPSTLTHSFVNSTHQSHLELPFRWAKESISLDLPRIQTHGPILFIKLSQTPTPGFNSFNDAMDGMDPKTIPLGLRSRTGSLSDPESDDSIPSDGNNLGHHKWLYLIIATKQMVFVLESHPGPKRTWHLCSEMASPFSPKTIDMVSGTFPLVHSQRSSVMSTSTSTSNSRSSVFTSRNLSSADCGEQSVLVTMKEYAVVIRLSDLTVREIELQGAMSTRQTTGGAGISSNKRKVNGVSGSLSSLASLEGVQATLMSLPRPGTSSNLSSEPMLTGRRLGEQGGSRDDSFRVDSRRLHRSANDRRWIGCEELLIPITHPRYHDPTSPRNGNTHTVLRSLYLVTRGHLTYAVLSPLGAETGLKRKAQRDHQSSSGASHNPVGVPSPIVLKPIHTFTWRAVPVKVRAHIVATPSEWNVNSVTVGSTRPVTADSTSQRPDTDEIFCCLTAFTPSGVEVQEGFISLNSLRSLWERPVHEPNVPRGGLKTRQPFFTPASEHLAKLSNDFNQTLDPTQWTRTGEKKNTTTGTNTSTKPLRVDEFTDTSSYDYNAKIGFLCDGGAWFSTGSKAKPGQLSRNTSYDSDKTDDSSRSTLNGDEPVNGYRNVVQGQFFWKESMGEWKIMYICHDSNS